MLIHRKNTATHCKINDICIAWMLLLCNDNAIHCEINDTLRIAWMLIQCKNDAIHCKINDMCIAWMLIHCKNNQSIIKSKIYVLPGC